MIEFLWFIVLVVTMVGISTARTRSMKLRLRGVLGVLSVLALCSFLYRPGFVRVMINLLLFFEWHPVLMAVLFVLSVGALIFAWRGQWTGRAVVGGALLAGGATLLLAFEAYCTLVILVTLGALGLLWFSRAASALLGWKFILMVILLAAGLFVTYLVHAKPQDYTTFWLTLGVSFAALLVAWRLGRRILASLFATIIVVVSGGLLLLKLGKPVPHIIDTIGDYVVLGLIVMCTYAAIRWVRRVPQLQPLGWASALMIAFLGAGLFLSSILYGEPQDFADIEAQFKYGSIGSDHFLARGIPYYIWEVLPTEFLPEKILGKIGAKKEDYQPLYGDGDGNKGRSYEAFGLIREKEGKKDRSNGNPWAKDCIEQVSEENKKVGLIVRPWHFDLEKFRFVTEEKTECITIDRPIGFSKRTVFRLDFAGINCAFCHASTIQKNAKSHQKIVLGMPANTVDIELFFQYLFGVAEDREFTSGNIFSAVLQGNFGNIKNAIVNMKNRPDKIMNAILDRHKDMEIGRPVFDCGFGGICQEIKNSFHRMAYRFVLIPLTWRYVTWLEEDFDFIKRFPRFGPGRVDAWSPGKRTLVKPPLPAEHPGTIDYTSIWNLKPRNGMRFHWDGNTDDVNERTIVAGLFVNGPNIETLDVKRVQRVIDWLNDRPAPRFDDFAPWTELRRNVDDGQPATGGGDHFTPKAMMRDNGYAQPAARLVVGSAPQSDPARSNGPGELVNQRKEGRIVFQHWCASCHAPDGDRIGRVEPIAELGTDPKRIEAFTTELQNALNAIERKARKKGDTWKLTRFRTQNGYVNMLLDGIWLRAPYLHNGSVPTLRDLLEKPENRPAEFYRGNPLYDWKRGGFKYEQTIEPEDVLRVVVGGKTTETREVGKDGAANAFGVEIDARGLTEKEAGTEFREQLIKQVEGLVQKEKINQAKDLLKKFGITMSNAEKLLRSISKEAPADEEAKKFCEKEKAKGLCEQVWSQSVTVTIKKSKHFRLFTFKTCETGNSNQGHLYGTALDNDDKEKLVEFLKSL